MKYILFFISFFVFINTFAQTNFRDSIDVINYQINLEIGNYTNQTIKGNTVITFSPKFDQTKIVKFDLLELNIEKIIVGGKQIKKFDYDKNIISINLNKLINKKDTLKIDIYYSGKPQKDAYWGGFYFTPKSTFNMGVGMASIPPCFGRVWFPCIDNFTDKATYNYHITVENDLIAACSGNLINQTTNKDKSITYNWEIKQPIPTYLASVSVANYSLVSKMVDNEGVKIPVEIYVYKSNEEKAEKSFANVQQCLNIFDSLFFDYQWDKIGFVESDFDGGAMEHATNINYPTYAIDGTLNWERLWVHEFSHSWFGNLVTCKTIEDMWLNEGWASYCESIFMENFYGNEVFKNYVRKNHFDVLTNAHLNDKGYFAVYGIPQSITYGSTVYNKGASVVHTLRNYVGDDLFFAALKKYFKDFAFQNIDTKEFKDSLSSYTGINLNDFFDFWVYEKGFNHFSVANFNSTKKNNKFNVYLKIKQRLIASTKFANSNKIEITFMNDSWTKTTKIINFSGEFGDSTYELDFEPTMIFVDLNEKIEDATTDCYRIIKSNGYQDFPSTLFDATVSNLKDSIFLRVQNNFISPENIESEKYIISQNQFWTIDGIFGDSKIEGKFYFKTKKDFILLYRKNQNANWEETTASKSTTYLKINDLKQGEYCLAVAKK